MKKNNKKIHAIVRMKNANVNDCKRRYVYLIQYTDKTYNIVDLKRKEDITDSVVSLDRKKSKLKFLMGGKNV